MEVGPVANALKSTSIAQAGVVLQGEVIEGIEVHRSPRAVNVQDPGIVLILGGVGAGPIFVAGIVGDPGRGDFREEFWNKGLKRGRRSALLTRVGGDGLDERSAALSKSLEGPVPDLSLQGYAEIGCPQKYNGSDNDQESSPSHGWKE